MGTTKHLTHQVAIAPSVLGDELDEVEHAASLIVTLVRQQTFAEAFKEQLTHLLCTLRCHSADGVTITAALRAVDALRERVAELEEDVRRRDVRIEQFRADAALALKESLRMRDVLTENTRLYNEVQHLRRRLADPERCRGRKRDRS